jgi:uracil-DNA glycosylase
LSKKIAYDALVVQRKKCSKCAELKNPSIVSNGVYDSGHIGPWSRWQGNLSSKMLIIGQDWGTIQFFKENKGLEPIYNPTNDALVKLLASIGVLIDRPRGRETEGRIFLTNAILCLKNGEAGGLQGAVQDQWFSDCGKLFLKPLIDLLKPRVIVTLGEKAYASVKRLYGRKRLPFRSAVEAVKGFQLTDKSIFFPRYHCGKRIQNTHRPMPMQLEDWSRLKPFLLDIHLNLASLTI